MPKQHSIISLETPSEEKIHTTSKPIFEPNTYNTTSDDYSSSDADSQVLENSALLGKIRLLPQLRE
jgi:hypothetical protein